jgi:cell division protein ZapE
LGLNGIVVKSHGGATAGGFGSAIRVAVELARSDYMEKVGANLQRLMAEPVYFAPLGPFASEAMDRAWARLTMGAAPRPVELDVQGRKLVARRAAAGCARFEFAELCERPLGAADYIQIAEHFDAVLLDDVPKLGPARREEAARFRNLIDALYEAKVKLVCAADAEPEDGAGGPGVLGRVADRLAGLVLHELVEVAGDVP